MSTLSVLVFVIASGASDATEKITMIPDIFNLMKRVFYES